MSVRIIQERLATYAPQTSEDEVQAAREITQEIALAALSRAGFFKAAAFQGGTCLRILYGLERFSEDLDFVLQKSNTAFSFEPYLAPMALELGAYGYRLEITDRSKVDNAVKKLFLKDQSGATAIEYGLIAAGISVAIIAVVQGLGTKLTSTFTSVSTALN